MVTFLEYAGKGTRAQPELIREAVTLHSVTAAGRAYVASVT